MEKQPERNKVAYSIQWKMLVMILITTLFSVVIGIHSISEFRRVEEVSTHIIKDHNPVSESVIRIFLSMNTGRLATEQVLDIGDYSKIEQINLLNEEIKNSFDKTNAYMAALTWGSETNAFRQSAGGANFRVWTDLGLKGNFVVNLSDELDSQAIGQSKIYYNSFIKKTSEAIGFHLESLRLKAEGKIVSGLEAEKQSAKLITETRHFYKLTLDSLDSLVLAIEISTREEGLKLLLVEEETRDNIIFILVIGLLTSFILSVLFARIILVEPLQKLILTAKEYGIGKLDTRINIDTNDEISDLAEEFNGMAERLSGYAKNLEREVEKRTLELNEKVSEAEWMNKLMIGREVRMAELKKEIENLKNKNKERKS